MYRVGEVKYNRFGSMMTIVKYTNEGNIDVRFENGYLAKGRQYGDFVRLNIKSPYCKTSLNVGFLGEGGYKASENLKDTIAYKYWRGMLNRCYCESTQKKQPTYEFCKIADEWHNFQNFAKWFDDNYYEVSGQKMHIDKDILNKNNKLYSPKTCIFTPQRINSMFQQSRKGADGLPTGVIIVKYVDKKSRYKARCCCGILKPRTIGIFDTQEEAFLAYKERKEWYIKQVANEYKNKIPKILYNAMCDYKIEITE